MSINEYPKWMHRKGETKVVTYDESRQALADGWTAEKPGTAPPSSRLNKHPEPGTTKADAAILDGPQNEVVERITALTDIAELNALCDFETSRKNRLTVTAAIQARINTLDATSQDSPTRLPDRSTPHRTRTTEHAGSEAESSLAVDEVPEPDAPVRRPQGHHKTRK